MVLLELNNSGSWCSSIWSAIVIILLPLILLLSRRILLLILPFTLPYDD